MINRIYFDLDECLISSYVSLLNNETFQFDVSIGVEEEVFHVKINPSAFAVLSFARSLVGKEKVWMLTSSIREYAEAINSACNLGFSTDQILSREDIEKIVNLCRFDCEFNNPHQHKNNVLIDNLPCRNNEEKMIVGGISPERYLQVKDYYGQYDPSFSEKVKSFLKEHEN